MARTPSKKRRKQRRIRNKQKVRRDIRKSGGNAPKKKPS